MFSTYLKKIQLWFVFWFLWAFPSFFPGSGEPLEQQYPQFSYGGASVSNTVQNCGPEVISLSRLMEIDRREMEGSCVMLLWEAQNLDSGLDGTPSLFPVPRIQSSIVSGNLDLCSSFLFLRITLSSLFPFLVKFPRNN